MSGKTKQSLDGRIIHVEKNVAIYKIVGSPFYRARVWIPTLKKRVVRSTKATSRIEAMRAAQEYARELSNMNLKLPTLKQYTFDHYADQFFKHQQQLIDQGQRHPQQQRNDRYRLYDTKIGLAVFFKGQDVRNLTTRSFLEFLEFVRTNRPTITASSTFNHLASCFRKVLKQALQEGIIDRLPDTPRPERKETPRSFFKFYPIVSRTEDEYKKILDTAKRLSEDSSPNGDIPISPDLYDFILWQTHTFMRPTESEAFGVRFKDITVIDNDDDGKRHLLIRLSGKTGFRTVVSMPAAVTVLRRLQKRCDDPSAFLFLPHTKNRTNASNYMGRMFRHVLRASGITPDDHSSGAFTLYSLRHTSICMRLVNSRGKINVFTLAKNAGTSVEQISRFYAKQLPIAEDLIKNLQSFGE